MAFQTGTATSLANLIATLDTFLTANGWTQDQATPGSGIYAWNKNSMFVQVRWDTSSPNFLGIAYSTAFINIATLPGNHTGDDGQINISGTDADIDNGRHVQIGNGSSIQYWFFEQDSNPAYVHIVVERSTGAYVHWGFGELDKIGNWSGGEYCYGQWQDLGFSGDKFQPLSPRNSFLLDGMIGDTGSGEDRAATVKLTGSEFGEAGTVEWGCSIGDMVSVSVPNDRAGNAKGKIQGGFRGGLYALPLGFVRGNQNTGLVHMYPVSIAYFRANRVYMMGSMADVRGISLRSFAPEQTFVYGGDTWYVFPTLTKNTDTEFGNMQGIAYKRVDA